jgi:hypothetical protein
MSTGTGSSGSTAWNNSVRSRLYSQVIPFDNQLEATGIANSSAIRIGAMMQDLHTQYHRAALAVAEGGLDLYQQRDAAKA